MFLSRSANVLQRGARVIRSKNLIGSRNVTTTQTGALLPEPQKTQFGLFGILCTVVPGLLIGAAISKTIANFLEENDLFVPSDDDDDDD